MAYTSRQVVSTDKAPKAIGPYSQAIRYGQLVFACGSIALDPQSGELVSGGLQAQTRQALSNLSNILQAAGSHLDHVLKTTVFMTDMRQFAEMNAVYAEFFPVAPPARSTVQVAALPKGALVEIEAIAAT